MLGPRLVVLVAAVWLGSAAPALSAVISGGSAASSGGPSGSRTGNILEHDPVFLATALAIVGHALGEQVAAGPGAVVPQTGSGTGIGRDLNLASDIVAAVGDAAFPDQGSVGQGLALATGIVASVGQGMSPASIQQTVARQPGSNAAASSVRTFQPPALLGQTTRTFQASSAQAGNAAPVVQQQAVAAPQMPFFPAQIPTLPLVSSPVASPAPRPTSTPSVSQAVTEAPVAFPNFEQVFSALQSQPVFQAFGIPQGTVTTPVTHAWQTPGASSQITTQTFEGQPTGAQTFTSTSQSTPATPPPFTTADALLLGQFNALQQQWLQGLSQFDPTLQAANPALGNFNFPASQTVSATGEAVAASTLAPVFTPANNEWQIATPTHDIVSTAGQSATPASATFDNAALFGLPASQPSVVQSSAVLQQETTDPVLASVSAVPDHIFAALHGQVALPVSASEAVLPDQFAVPVSAPVAVPVSASVPQAVDASASFSDPSSSLEFDVAAVLTAASLGAQHATEHHEAAVRAAEQQLAAQQTTEILETVEPALEAAVTSQEAQAAVEATAEQQQITAETAVQQEVSEQGAVGNNETGQPDAVTQQETAPATVTGEGSDQPAVNQQDINEVASLQAELGLEQSVSNGQESLSAEAEEQTVQPETAGQLAVDDGESQQSLVDTEAQVQDSGVSIVEVQPVKPEEPEQITQDVLSDDGNQVSSSLDDPQMHQSAGAVSGTAPEVLEVVRLDDVGDFDVAPLADGTATGPETDDSAFAGQFASEKEKAEIRRVKSGSARLLRGPDGNVKYAKIDGKIRAVRPVSRLPGVSTAGLQGVKRVRVVPSHAVFGANAALRLPSGRPQVAPRQTPAAPAGQISGTGQRLFGHHPGHRYGQRIITPQAQKMMQKSYANYYPWTSDDRQQKVLKPLSGNARAVQYDRNANNVHARQTVSHGNSHTLFTNMYGARYNKYGTFVNGASVPNAHNTPTSHNNLSHNLRYFPRY